MDRRVAHRMFGEGSATGGPAMTGRKGLALGHLGMVGGTPVMELWCLKLSN